MCMTKMQSNGHDLVCPVCGYKYCGDHIPYAYDDHDHNQYKSYSSQTTYTGAKTSGSNSGNQTSGKNTASYYNGSSAGSSSSSRNSSGYSSSNRKKKKSPVARIVFFVIFFYIIVNILTVFGTFMEESGMNFQELIENIVSALEEADSPSKNIQINELPPASVISDDPFGLLADGDHPYTLAQQIAHKIFDKDPSAITSSDLCKVEELTFSPDGLNGEYYVTYVLDDERSDYISTDFTELDLSELHLFYNLEVLNCPGYQLKPGDLEGLYFLYQLSCGNQPAELQDIIEPTQLYDLTLEGMESLDMTGITAFSNLSRLYLDAQNITGTSGIGNLTNLYVLIFSDYTTEDFSFLSSLSNLGYLVIYSENLNDISFLKGMENLCYLSLFYTQVSDLTPLTYCQNLEYLDISYDENLQDLSPVGKLSNLTRLLFDYSNVYDISFAKDLYYLETIGLSNTGVSDLSPLNELPFLRDVDCRACPISDYGTLKEKDIAFQE